MNTSYHSLPSGLVSPQCTLNRLPQPEPGSVVLSDAAERVYTDLSGVRPFSVRQTTPIDQVNEKMIACGVRLLFVTDPEDNLQGLVTYSDLFGDKPVRYIREHGGARDDILVQDIMTPVLQLEALAVEDVNKARVGDIIATIKTAGRQHMLVSASDDDGRQSIVGMFSSTHVEKLVGLKIELSARAQSFADLERALG